MGVSQAIVSLSVDKINLLDLLVVDRPGPPSMLVWLAQASRRDVNATIGIHNTNPYPVNFDWAGSLADDTAGSAEIFRLYCKPS